MVISSVISMLDEDDCGLVIGKKIPAMLKVE